MRSRFWFVASVAVLVLCSACAPGIGDSCTNALNCSTSGTRICDRTQPGGYCTLQGCEKGTCPDEAVCVKFRPSVDRLSTTYCMRTCAETSDCRDGYKCVHGGDGGRHFGGPCDSEILGKSSQKFCAVLKFYSGTMAGDEDAGPTVLDTGDDSGVIDDGSEAESMMCTDSTATGS